jgi:hypothetical protein
MKPEIHIWRGLTPPIYVKFGILPATAPRLPTTILAANDGGTK